MEKAREMGNNVGLSILTVPALYGGMPIAFGNGGDDVVQQLSPWDQKQVDAARTKRLRKGQRWLREGRCNADSN